MLFRSLQQRKCRICQSRLGSDEHCRDDRQHLPDGSSGSTCSAFDGSDGHAGHQLRLGHLVARQISGILEQDLADHDHSLRDLLRSRTWIDPMVDHGRIVQSCISRARVEHRRTCELVGELRCRPRFQTTLYGRCSFSTPITVSRTARFISRVSCTSTRSFSSLAS